MSIFDDEPEVARFVSLHGTLGLRAFDKGEDSPRVGDVYALKVVAIVDDRIDLRLVRLPL